MKGQKKLFWLFLLCCLFFAPQDSQASAAKKKTAGGGLEGVKVHVYAKAGGSDWFIAKTKKINKYGILQMENVVSGGWGKIELAGNGDEKAYAGKTFTTKMRLLDHKGRKIKKPTPVDLYAKIGGVKHKVASIKTDSRGWIVVPHATLGIESYIEVKGSGDKMDEDYREVPVVRANSKMKGGKWFVANQQRLDKNRYLKIKNATSGKVEFEYVGKYEKISVSDLIDELNESGKLSDHLAEKFKESDFAGKTFPKPFNLKVQVLDDDGHSITKPTKVKMTAYLKDRTLEGYMTTNSKGWLTVKGVPVDIKTKMEVKD